MVHEGLRVGEECRGGGAPTQRLPQGVEGGWRGKNGGRRRGRSSQTYHDTPALGILLIWLSVLTLHILTGPSRQPMC